MPISPGFLSLLRQARYDPAARRGYDHFAGGFLWSDEFPEGWSKVTFRLDDWLQRKLVADRAAVILGGDVDRFMAIWQEVERVAPDWPGLRPERRDRAVSAELIAKREEVEAGLEALDQRIRSAKRPT